MHYLEWLSKLISFDSTSRNSNLHLINYVNEYLKSESFETHLTYSPDKKKANLFATLAGTHSAKEGGLILSGHTDVVPIDGQQWKTPPFEATLLENKIYGRGSCDMKGFLAVCFSLVPDFIKMKCRKPLHLALSYDEEVGCLGAPLMIEDFLAREYKPRACLVGEPSGMLPIIAHKGKSTFLCKFHGRAAHSSLTSKGCNAIEHAASLIVFLRQLAERHQQSGPFDPCFDLAYTTFSTNIIHGGNAENTIPSFCELLFEFRNLPEDDAKILNQTVARYLSHQLLPIIKQESSSADIELITLASIPAFQASESAPLTQCIRQITGEKRTLKVSYGTEAGQFQQAGIISTLVCGPGSIEQAHGPDEYVTQEQLEECRSLLLKLVNVMLND